MTTRFGVFCLITGQLTIVLLYAVVESPPLAHWLGHLVGLTR